MLGEQQIDDLLAGGLVEIAGRLVGEQDRRIGRERARQRDALLLAAGELRRIVMQPFAEPDRGQLLLGARMRVGSRRRVRAAPRRSPARSWSGSGGTTGRRCRRCVHENVQARPRPVALKLVPSTTTSPLSGRSSPAMTMSSVDLPEPDGPIRPTALPEATRRLISFRICTRAAPEPSDRLTFARRDCVGAHAGPQVKDR